MANTQQLNPAGYLINDDPINVNPFFDWDGETDPSLVVRVQNLENSMTEAEQDIEDLETEMGTVDNRLDSVEDDITHFNQDIIDINSKFNNYYTKSETYTKQEVNNLIPYIPSLDSYYTKTQSDSRYYTKTQIDSMIGEAVARLEVI